MTEIWEYTFNHPMLNEVLDILTLKQFYRETNTEPSSQKGRSKVDLTNVTLEQAAFISSILASSPEEEHKQKALAFAVLAYLDKKDPQYASYCYVILSRTSNIQQGKHLPEIITKDANAFKIQFDEMLNLELGVARELSYLQAGDRELFLSEFQKKLWLNLKDNNRLTAISGPTSSGKSFIVQNYFIESCHKKQSFKGLYIVPTRALIYEVSAAFRKGLGTEDVDVQIGFGESLDENKKEIFVLTPERCHRLLKENSDKLKIDLIFLMKFRKWKTMNEEFC